MRFRDSVLMMVGDFAAMKRASDFSPTVAPTASDGGMPPDCRGSLHHKERLARAWHHRAQRINSPVPIIDAKLYVKARRRMTAPLVSNVAASAMLRRKLEKLLEERRTASDDEALKVGGERIELCWAGKLM
ncbi:unnamed protein product [Heligmosomoides polygyrus]|uniref:Uncharacterized protein n=1 Tax=Heligmosomoides polygyrus TaxID=6339 RepID=A0A183GIM4_HELPZ|nr:unnamed protein product [Heligmosomoides polygyrus]